VDEMNKGCPGALIFKDARPDYIDCPQCGEEVEIWSDEPLARCTNCNFWVSQQRGASCIDWCKAAVECIGLEAYERLQRTRPPEETVAEASTTV
jgi:DNA-directed RNA polymerase subunit RPC12/RpoP